MASASSSVDTTCTGLREVPTSSIENDPNSAKTFVSCGSVTYLPCGNDNCNNVQCDAHRPSKWVDVNIDRSKKYYRVIRDNDWKYSTNKTSNGKLLDKDLADRDPAVKQAIDNGNITYGLDIDDGYFNGFFCESEDDIIFRFGWGKHISQVIIPDDARTQIKMTGNKVADTCIRCDKFELMPSKLITSDIIDEFLNKLKTKGLLTLGHLGYLMDQLNITMSMPTDSNYSELMAIKGSGVRLNTPSKATYKGMTKYKDFHLDHIKGIAIVIEKYIPLFIKFNC
jgi:hypothetical protein